MTITLDLEITTINILVFIFQGLKFIKCLY